MTEIKSKGNFFDSRKRKGKMFNEPMSQTGNGSSLTQGGRIWKNNYLDTDLTSQQATRRKLK